MYEIVRVYVGLFSSLRSLARFRFGPVSVRSGVGKSPSGPVRVVRRRSPRPRPGPSTEPSTEIGPDRDRANGPDKTKTEAESVQSLATHTYPDMYEFMQILITAFGYQVPSEAFKKMHCFQGLY